MYKEELFKDLLKENDEIAAKRKATQKKCYQYSKKHNQSLMK